MMFVIHSKKYGDKEVLIDDEDLGKVKRYKWSIYKGTKSAVFYVKTNIKVRGKKTGMKMHRYLIPIKKGRMVDHINGNGLDNRKSNLRICDNHQNNMNKKLRKDSRFPFKGIYYHFEKGRVKRWSARIQAYKKNYCLGYFNTKEEAYKAYCAAAKKYHGEFARLK